MIFVIELNVCIKFNRKFNPHIIFLFELNKTKHLLNVDQDEYHNHEEDSQNNHNWHFSRGHQNGNTKTSHRN